MANPLTFTRSILIIFAFHLFWAQVPVAISYLESLLSLPVPADGSALVVDISNPIGGKLKIEDKGIILIMMRLMTIDKE